MRLGSQSHADPNKPAKPPSSPEYREMHVKLGFLAIAVIINIIGFSILIPLAPYFIKNALGPSVSATDPRVGELGSWLTAVYALMQFFFAPLWGRLSDKIGRKPILIGSLVGDAVFYTLFGLSHSLPQLFACRILAGIFSSATLAVAQAYAADVTPPEHRATGLGMIGASFGVGFILGPALGGPLGKISLGLPLFVAAGLAVLNLIYIVLKLPESRQPTDDTVTGPPPAVTSRLGGMFKAVTGPIGFLYLLTFAVTFAFANLEGTFTAYLMQHMGLSKQSSLSAQGGIFAFIGVIIVLIQGGLVRVLVKRLGEAKLVVAGIALMAVGFLLFPFAHSIPALLFGPMIPIAVGNGLNTPSLRALISRKSASNVQGTMLGLSASFDSLARATGPGAAGWLYGHMNPQSPYVCAGIVMALSLIIALVNWKELAVASVVSITSHPPTPDAVAKS